MARYINLDEAIKHLQFDCKAKYPLSYSNGISVAIREIGKLPTADVAPKSEVAKEIFEEIDKSIVDPEYQAKTPRKTVKVEELKTQCDWILHEVIPKALAKLKKKYTGSGDTNDGT